MKKLRFTFLVSATLLLICFSAVSQDKSFTRITLRDGTSLEIPGHWQTLSEESRKNIRAASDAVINKAGLGDSVGKTTLLAARSTPELAGAIVRVSTTSSSELTQGQLAALSKDDLRILSDATASDIQAAAAAGGLQIIKVDPVRITFINGQRALAISYLRRSLRDNKPWRVTQYKVPINDHLYEITLSYRLSDAVVWRPILERVKESIIF